MIDVITLCKFLRRLTFLPVEDLSLSAFGWNPLLHECSYLRSHSVWCFKMLLWGSEILLLLSSSRLCVLAVFNRVHRGNSPFSTHNMFTQSVYIDVNVLLWFVFQTYTSSVSACLFINLVDCFLNDQHI